MEINEDSEFQKMISGAIFDSSRPRLVSKRNEVRRLCKEYNDSIGHTEDLEKRFQHVSSIFGAIGRGSYVEPPLQVDYGINIEVGRNFYSNFDIVILDCAKVIIGDNVSFGPGVHLYTVNHPQDPQTGHYLSKAKPITIGSNVWLGGRVVVLPGVTIGEGCTIGAGSVVTKDVPPFSMAVGNPARVIRKLK